MDPISSTPANASNSIDGNASYSSGDGDMCTQGDPPPNHVEVCSRPARIDLGEPLNTITDGLGVDKTHVWLKTDNVEYGMGPVPGAPDEYGAPTMQVDQTDSHLDPEATCTTVDDVDPGCVESNYAPGTDTGDWEWPINYCHTYVDDILDKCTTAPGPEPAPDPELTGAGYSE